MVKCLGTMDSRYICYPYTGGMIAQIFHVFFFPPKDVFVSKALASYGVLYLFCVSHNLQVHVLKFYFAICLGTFTPKSIIIIEMTTVCQLVIYFLLFQPHLGFAHFI